MARPRKYFGRKPSEKLGAYLKHLREDNSRLTLANVEKKLKIKGGHLSMIESGKRTAPDQLLIKLAKLYSVPPEALLIQAYWPQLAFLSTIMEPDKLPSRRLKDINNMLEKEEKEELNRYAAFLLLRRKLPLGV